MALGRQRPHSSMRHRRIQHIRNKLESGVLVIEQPKSKPGSQFKPVVYQLRFLYLAFPENFVFTGNGDAVSPVRFVQSPSKRLVWKRPRFHERQCRKFALTGDRMPLKRREKIENFAFLGDRMSPNHVLRAELTRPVR